MAYNFYLCFGQMQKKGSGFFYYIIIFISVINVALTYYYTTLDISKDKFLSHMMKSPIGKVESMGSVILVLEVVFILLYVFVLNR